MNTTKMMNTLVMKRQQGATLLIVLLLLLIMTLLGLASLRGTIMGEKSTGNLYDRSLAFQAAETALREAEASVTINIPTFPAAGQSCTNGLCPAPTGGANVWLANTGWRVSTANLGTIAAAASYLIEPVGFKERTTDCVALGGTPDECNAPVYRITARSNADNRAQVILQTNYARP